MSYTSEQQQIVQVIIQQLKQSPNAAYATTLQHYLDAQQPIPDTELETLITTTQRDAVSLARPITTLRQRNRYVASAGDLLMAATRAIGKTPAATEYERLLGELRHAENASDPLVTPGVVDRALKSSMPISPPQRSPKSPTACAKCAAVWCNYAPMRRPNCAGGCFCSASNR